VSYISPCFSIYLRQYLFLCQKPFCQKYVAIPIYYIIHCISAKICLRQTVFVPKSIFPAKTIISPKIFLRQNYYFSQKYFYAKIVFTPKSFLRQNYFVSPKKKKFWPKIFLRQRKKILAKNISTPNIKSYSQKIEKSAVSA